MANVTADKLIAEASKYVGYLEKKTNSNLDSMTGNAGENNFTSFARDYMEYTGINAQGQAWCDVFVDTCFIKAFGVEKAKSLLGGFSAYTPTSAQKFKDMKQWYSTPQVGDVIFFKNTERICHTGIVYKIDSTNVYTIEGNTSGGSDVIANGGGVFKKQYVLSNSRIAGYGRPKYDSTYTATTKKTNLYTKPSETINIGDKGDSVKWLQYELVESGYKLSIDGVFGEDTQDAVKKFQKSCKITVDGIVGNATISKLIADK